MPSILFVCTANRFRSPLAAAMLKKRLDDDRTFDNWHVSSAGTWAESGLPAITPPDILKEYHLDLSRHRSTSVTRELLSDYDLIVVMEIGHKEALRSEFPQMQKRVFLLSDVVEQRHYSIPDKFETEHEMKEVIAELDSLIERGYDSICTLAANLHDMRYGAVS